MINGEKKWQKEIRCFLTGCVMTFLCLISVNGQPKNINPSEADKVELINVILSNHDFFLDDNETEIDEVFLSTENLPKYLYENEVSKKKFHKSKISFITREEIDKTNASSNSRIEYYYFKPFKVQKNTVIATFAHILNGYGNSTHSWREYKCKKNRNNWTCQLYSVTLGKS